MSIGEKWDIYTDHIFLNVSFLTQIETKIIFWMNSFAIYAVSWMNIDL